MSLLHGKFTVARSQSSERSSLKCRPEPPSLGSCLSVVPLCWHDDPGVCFILGKGEGVPHQIVDLTRLQGRNLLCKEKAFLHLVLARYFEHYPPLAVGFVEMIWGLCWT